MSVRQVKEGWLVDSPRTGGKYIWEGGQDAGALSDLDRAKITSWLVDERRLGADAPRLTFKIITACKHGRRRSVHDRAYMLLRYLVQKTELIGTSVDAFTFLSADQQSEDYWPFMAWSESTTVKECQFLFDCLVEKGLIFRTPGSIDDLQKFVVTPTGFGRIEELDAVAAKADQAFVAMWFDDSMRNVYDEAIAPAIDSSGFRPLRIDRKDHNNKIDDEIIAEIRRSRFVVADFTHGPDGPRGGVYYEAGFAYGLGIPVIFTCKQEMLKEGKIHFDTRQYNHIGWTDVAELRERLYHRIAATLGDGPLKKK